VDGERVEFACRRRYVARRPVSSPAGVKCGWVVGGNRGRDLNRGSLSRMTLSGWTTLHRGRGKLLHVNIAATLRSEPVTRFVEEARNGLAQTFVGRGEQGPPGSRRREQLMRTAASLGGLLICLALIVLATGRTGGRGDALAAGFLGVLLLAPRFRLTAWRVGLLASLVAGLFGEGARAATTECVVLVVLFCVAATVAPRVVIWWMAALMLAVLWITMPDGAGGSAVGLTGLIIAAAVAMDAIRGWRQTREALVVETDHAEREQARRAVLEERARIGRELHDVVAHHMSLIAVQAETAPYRLGEVPEPVRGEFTAISAAARTALAEMRRLLGVLRNNEEAARAPQPQIDQIEDMVATARSAGITVDYTPADAVDTVPQSIGVCAYRIVQEALTNASRHAPGGAVTVQLVRNDDALRIEVVNGPGRTGVAGNGDAGSGQGLTGMRERASLLGGALTAGPTTDGGFAVTAVLPFDDV
jgi:signal transduction histidine kinase